MGDFRRRFAEAATEQFGSGWAWLVKDERGRLAHPEHLERRESRSSVDSFRCSPWTCGSTRTTSTIESERDRYVRGFLDHLVNWDFVVENLEAARIPSARR